MKTYEELIKEGNLNGTLNEYIRLDESDFQYLNESERAEVQSLLKEFGDKKVSELDEGFFGQLIGGAAGLIVGPALGKVIANALGIEKGILYDMLTSRLVTTALGAAIGKYATSKK